MTPDGTFFSAKGGDLEANGKSACSFWMTDAKAASKWVLTLKRPNAPAASTENSAFAVAAEAGLDLVVRGYGSGDVPFFEERVNAREIYKSVPHYIVRVDEDVIFSNQLLRVCVEDLTGKWDLIPVGSKGEICDDKPVDNRGTYSFVGRTFPQLANPVGSMETQVDASAGAGVVAKFGFPLAGTIRAWTLYFAFETDCENDHYATITSPKGRTIIVMDRGLHRCSGTPTRFSSENDNEGGNFVGSEALGQWQFSFKDLDKNAHSGVLTSVWMKLSVEKNGVVTDHTVSIDGLPRDVPNPT